MMELQNKFEEIINNEVSPSYLYSYLEGVEEAAKECTKLCLEQQLQQAKSIENIKKEAFEAGLGLTQDNWEKEDWDKWNNYLKLKENRNISWEERFIDILKKSDFIENNSLDADSNITWKSVELNNCIKAALQLAKEIHDNACEEQKKICANEQEGTIEAEYCLNSLNAKFECNAEIEEPKINYKLLQEESKKRIEELVTEVNTLKSIAEAREGMIILYKEEIKEYKNQIAI